MKVKELISALLKVDAELEILIEGTDYKMGSSWTGIMEETVWRKIKKINDLETRIVIETED